MACIWLAVLDETRVMNRSVKERTRNSGVDSSIVSESGSMSVRLHLVRAVHAAQGRKQPRPERDHHEHRAAADHDRADRPERVGHHAGAELSERAAGSIRK